MLFDPSNFLTHVRSLVTGGGRKTDGSPYLDSGFVVDVPVQLGAVDLRTVINYDGSEAGAAIATLSGSYLAANETNARVIRVDAGTDAIGTLTFPIPRDYDEATDELKVQVHASMVTLSTDDDVQLDSSTFIKKPSTVLGPDISPAAPSTLLTVAGVTIDFDLSGNGLERQDIVNFNLLTNGANDTTGEEVLIHGLQFSYRSTLVSYNEETTGGVLLR